MPDDWEFHDNSQAAKEALREGLINGIEDVVDDILDRARDDVPVDTGNLMRSIRKGDKTVEKNKVTQEFGAFTEYAAATEFGSAPHKITPNEKDYLRFKWFDAPTEIQEQRGEENPVMFLKEVNHPGTDPQPFMRPAIHAALTGTAAKKMTDAITEALRKRLGEPQH